MENQTGIISVTEDSVEIFKSEYETLLKAQAKLSALEEAGVDNWSGYGDAMDILRQNAD